MKCKAKNGISDYLAGMDKFSCGNNKPSTESARDTASDSEQALLDALLSSRLEPGDRKRTVADLFGSFSSLRQIIYAPKRSILAVTKKGAIAHDELQKARKLAIALAKVEIKNQPVLTQYDELIYYCRTFLAGERREQFHALFLDKARGLIDSECLATGTIDHVSVYPRELFGLALEYAAASIILVHNHPSGEPQPSRADIRMTRRLAKVGHYLGITLSDHIIVGSSGTYSFRVQDEVEFGRNNNLDLNKNALFRRKPSNQNML